MSKPGFMFYHDDYHALDELSDASHRRVLDAMVLYSETGELTQGLDLTERIVFGIMRNAIDRDNERYQNRAAAGRKGGINSGEARRSKLQEDEAKRSRAKLASNERSKRTNSISNTNSNSNINSNTNTISLSERGGDGEERGIPSVDEVREYAELAGLEVNAEAFVMINGARNWTDGNGQPIRDWRMWLENSSLTKRKEDRHESTAEPDRTGQRDEYGALYL